MDISESRLTLVSFGRRCPDAAREALARLDSCAVLAGLGARGFAEGAALSTCNRFELALARGPRAAEAVGLLETLAGLGLRAHARVFHEAEAARHLFEVAAGLDSLVVGESEILGQVKAAYERSHAAGMTGKTLNVLFQRALYIGKRVRTETSIAVGQTSVASVAVQLAETIFGGLKGRSVLVLGAGAMAEVTVKHLRCRGVSRVTISNRTFERAAALAARFEAGAVPWKDFPSALHDADIVITSTGSPDPVVTRPLVESARRGRGSRPLFLIDIAMPRDVEEGAHELDGVYLYRLEHLSALAEENLRGREGEVALARALVEEKSSEFGAWLGSLGSARELSLRHSPRPAAS